MLPRLPPPALEKHRCPDTFWMTSGDVSAGPVGPQGVAEGRGAGGRKGQGRGWAPRHNPGSPRVTAPVAGPMVAPSGLTDWQPCHPAGGRLVQSRFGVYPFPGEALDSAPTGRPRPPVPREFGCFCRCFLPTPAPPGFGCHRL